MNTTPRAWTQAPPAAHIWQAAFSHSLQQLVLDLVEEGASVYASLCMYTIGKSLSLEIPCNLEACPCNIVPVLLALASAGMQFGGTPWHSTRPSRLIGNNVGHDITHATSFTGFCTF